MNLWQRIAKFFTEWDGEDMTKTMPLSVDDLRLVNSQRIMLTTLERERKEIRARTIEEFAERMSLEISESIVWGMLVNSDKDNSFSDTSDKIVDYVVDTAKKIAEQMKGGAE